MDSNENINTNFTSKTFLAYFAFYPGVFFGNVGRYDDIFFPERPEVFNMEACIEENLFKNEITNDNHNHTDICKHNAKNNTVKENKLARFKKHESVNLKVYQARLKKLLSIHYHLLQVLEKDNKMKENMAAVFQKFFAELQTLQENFKYQRDSIIRSHMIDIFGHFEDADDKPFNFSNLNFLNYI
jgi:hypothetical protein